MQDKYGISLFGYAAGIGIVAVDSLLNVLLEGGAQGSIGLLTCGITTRVVPQKMDIRQITRHFSSMKMPPLFQAEHHKAEVSF